MYTQNFLIVHDDGRIEGPLTEQELLEQKSKLSEDSWVVKSFQEPAFIQDKTSFQHLHEDEAPRTRVTSMKINKSIFANSEHFQVVKTMEQNQQTQKTLKPILWIILSAACLSALGFYFYNKRTITSPPEPNSLEVQESATPTQLEVKAMAVSAPESMQAQLETVTEKLRGEDLKYALSLLKLDEVRDSFSENLLQTPEMIAAVVLHVIPANDLQKDSRWTKFLARHPELKERPLYLIAQAAADVVKQFHGFLNSAQKKGAAASHKTNNSPFLLWGLNPNKNGIEPGSADFSTVFSAVDTTTEQFEKVPALQRTYRNIIVSRLVFYAVSYTWFLPKSSPQEPILKLLEQSNNLSGQLEPEDKDFTQHLIDERNAALQGNVTNAKAVDSRAQLLENLESATSDSLCSASRSVVSKDWIAQTLLMYSRTKKSMPSSQSIFSKCWMTSSSFFPLRLANFGDEPDSNKVTEYFPRVAAKNSPALQQYFSNLKSFPWKTWSKQTKDKLDPAFSWHLWLWKSGVRQVPIESSWIKQWCNKRKVLTCMQMMWEITSDSYLRYLMIQDHQNLVKKNDLPKIAFELSVHMELHPEWKKKVPSPKSKVDKGDDLTESPAESIVSQVNQWIEDDHPDLPSLQWYTRNRDFIKP